MLVTSPILAGLVEGERPGRVPELTLPRSSEYQFCDGAKKQNPPSCVTKSPCPARPPNLLKKNKPRNGRVLSNTSSWGTTAAGARANASHQCITVDSHKYPPARVPGEGYSGILERHCCGRLRPPPPLRRFAPKEQAGSAVRVVYHELVDVLFKL